MSKEGGPDNKKGGRSRRSSSGMASGRGREADEGQRRYFPGLRPGAQSSPIKAAIRSSTGTDSASAMRLQLAELRVALAVLVARELRL
jgi:hypothetical protein